MKYLIWGTGKRAKAFIEREYLYFTENEIIAFIDNNVEKKSSSFYGKKIISPDEIKNYKYDQILILSVYEKEIGKQLENQLGIDKLIIKKRDDIYGDGGMLYSYYEGIRNISKKSILLVAETSVCKEFLIYSNFNIIGILTFEDLNKICDYEYDYVWITKHEGMSKEKILWEVENIKRLTSKYNVARDEILCDSIAEVYLKSCKKLSFGEENTNKTFLVIGGGMRGLAALVHDVQAGVQYAQEHGYIPVVDWMTQKCQYHDNNEIGQINAWEKFFEQPAGYRYEDICKSKNIVIFGLSIPVKCEANKKWFPTMKTFLRTTIEEYWNKNDMGKKKVLGVKFRGSDYANKKTYLHYIQPTLDEMVFMVNKKLAEWSNGRNYDAIFLCTEVEEAVTRFKEEFGDMLLYYPQERLPENWSYWTFEYPYQDNSYKQGVAYWTDIVILSRCESIIAGRCGGTEMALDLNNGKYIHQYIFNLGKYGIDDC